MPPNKSSKRPTRAKQPWEKMHAITRVKNGESKAAVARSMDVPESTLRGWCKNSEKIEASTRQPSSSPTSRTSTEFSESREKRIKLDDTVSVAVTIPPAEVTEQAPIDLSRTSPKASASKTENGLLMNPQDISKYYQAARFNQVFQALQQAQGMNLLNNGGTLLTPARSPTINGSANLPNDRIPTEESVRQWLHTASPSQISPNSSGATLLSTPLNGQPTTSPIAGNTPEQQTFYLEWYKAMMTRVGLGAPFNMTQNHGIPILYNQLMNNNNTEKSATVSHPAAPRQPTNSQTVSNQPREEIEVPEMHQNVKAQKPGSPLSTETLQDKNERSPTTNRSTPPDQSPSTSEQSQSTTDQSHSSSSSQDSEKPAKSAPSPVPKKSKQVSLENVVSVLKESVGNGREDDRAGNIHECIETAEKFLQALEKNSSHPSVTAFQLKQVKSFIATFTAAVEISSKRKRKLQ